MSLPMMAALVWLGSQVPELLGDLDQRVVVVHGRHDPGSRAGGQASVVPEAPPGAAPSGQGAPSGEGNLGIAEEVRRGREGADGVVDHAEDIGLLDELAGVGEGGVAVAVVILTGQQLDLPPVDAAGLVDRVELGLHPGVEAWVEGPLVDAAEGDVGSGDSAGEAGSGLAPQIGFGAPLGVQVGGLVSGSARGRGRGARLSMPWSRCRRRRGRRRRRLLGAAACTSDHDERHPQCGPSCRFPFAQHVGCSPFLVVG